MTWAVGSGAVPGHMVLPLRIPMIPVRLKPTAAFHSVPMMTSFFRTLFLGLLAVWMLAGCQHAKLDSSTVAAPAIPPVSPSLPTTAEPVTTYVFGWGDLPVALARPRGGTSKGASTTLAPARPLPAEQLGASAKAKDRAAILALAGDYRVSFHFMESVGLTADYKPTRPYHSWATEQVRVLEDRPDFISLQHTLVMFFAEENGKVSPPAVMKHWRQDWTYEDRDLHSYRGARIWGRVRPSPEEVKGAWSQAVYQVDDSPRYESLGRWEHRGNLSVWTSDRAWRPLPRRESTVRKDYRVMEGVHRIVLTPTGWLHEQQNWKRVAGEETDGPPVYVAQEYGLDRYERITAPSLEAADEYWTKTGPYWDVVRRGWASALATHDRFQLLSEKDGEPLFALFFDYAEKLMTGTPFDRADAEKQVRETIGRYLTKS